MNLWDESHNDSEVPSQRKVKRPESPNGSHVVALTQTVQKRKSEKITIQPTEVHLTVQIPNKTLTRRHLRLIMDVLIYEIVTNGITFYQLMFLVHLYQQLMGSKTEPIQLNDEHERRLCLLSEIIIKDVSDKEFDTILPTECLTTKLKEEILNANLIMTKRTYNSRKGHWMPEDWMKIRTVGIDSIIDRNGKSERYSGYCKGYGESHPSAHYKKTRPSAELDGEEPPEPQVLRLKELEKLLYLNQLNLKPKAKRKKD